MSRRSVLVVVALIAVAAGGVGWLLGRQIESPAEVAARTAPPPASLISVPVEMRELSSAVVTRGTIEFEDTTGISVSGSESGSSIITRLNKQEGEELVGGDVIVEVAGRPLFVLEGELPVFRSFAPGLEGPDVLQLEEALASLGFDPGTVDGVYGSGTEAAIEELYQSAGYRPPAIDSGEAALVEGALERVDQAEAALKSAEEQSAPTALPQSTLLELDRSVSEAQANLDQLRADRDPVNMTRSELTSIDNAIASAVTGVRIAQAFRIETIEQAADSGDARQLDELRDGLFDARLDLERIQGEVGTRLPASELVFLPSLPRLIQDVNVDVGDIPTSSVMDVSGSEVAIVSGVSEADRALLEVGQIGFLDDLNLDAPVEAEIDFIADNPGGPDLSGDRYRIRLLPTATVPDEVFNQNFRLQIPISSTGGEVLTVPLAALSAAADGSSRVEKLIDADTTELTEVRVGLSAGGFVEVEALDGGSLATDDRVVVGRDEPEDDAPAEADDEDAESLADEEPDGA